MVHPLGEGDLVFKFLPAGSQFHLRSSDEALTAYGGLVAWYHFLKHGKVFERLAKNYPLPSTSPNATPVIDILKAFSLKPLNQRSHDPPRANPPLLNCGF